MPSAKINDKTTISMAVSAATNLQKFEFPNMVIPRNDLKAIVISIVGLSNISNTDYAETGLWFKFLSCRFILRLLYVLLS